MKDQIIELLKSLCEHETYNLCTVPKISENLKIGRNIVASKLQELVCDGICVKIEKRPSIYLHKQTVEKLYQVELKNSIYKQLEDIKIKSGDNKLDFDKLIGSHGSLKDLVSQCKATIAYPPKGLPMLLYGPTGTGKSLIAKLTYEFARNKQLVDGKFISINCSEYANNPELLTANLFGYVKGAFTGADKEKPGLIELADGGVLFLDEVHNLKAECQEKLFQFMDQAIYHRVGDNETWYTSNVRIIFATTEQPEEVLLKTLQRRIPMILTVPSLKERGKDEIIQLLHFMLQEEEKRIGKKIQISGKAFQLLLSYDFTGNIGELKSCIQFCCVNAYFQNGLENIKISLETLPKKLLNSIVDKKIIYTASKEYFDIQDLVIGINRDLDIICLNQDLMNIYLEYVHNNLTEQMFIENAQKAIHKYFDRSLKHKNNIKDFYIHSFQHIIELVSDQFGLVLSNNDALLLIQYIHAYHQHYYHFHNFTTQNEETLQQFLDMLKKKYHQDYSVANEISLYIHSYLSIEITPMMIIMLTLYLMKLTKSDWKQKRVALILAHGFSTASSIADAVNQFFGKHIFDAIDMSLNITTKEVLHQLNQYMKKKEGVEELLLLVDMGSLEEIYKDLQISNVNIGILNNISTKAALEIGNGLLQNQAMEEIFKSVIKYNKSSYHIVKNREKDKVILCSCASGLGTAEKLREIIEASLPNNVNIKVIAYNYQELLEYEKQNKLLEEMQIICVIGTLNPCIQNLNFIPIEDFIINDKLDDLDIYLRNYMDNEDYYIFKKNILKNFSLTNIMNSLTILNPNKLLEHVAEGLDRLQIIMNQKFSNHTCFGLYVHISCLIERLVLQKGIESYPCIEEFQVKQKLFIQYVKQALCNVEQYYSVEIPIEEVGYIYDYVMKDEKLTLQSVEDF